MKRYTVIFRITKTFDTGIGTCEEMETHTHRIKAKDAKAAADYYYMKHDVVAVVDGWPAVSGVDHQE